MGKLKSNIKQLPYDVHSEEQRSKCTHAHLLVLSYVSPVTQLRLPRILNDSAHSGMGLSISIKLLPNDPADLHLLLSCQFWVT